MDDIVITMRFSDAGRARRALHELERCDEDGRLRVGGAALLERSGQDRIRLGDSAGDESAFMPPAGIVGMLVDAVSGPTEVLYARPTEGFHGHGADAGHEDEYELALETISRALEPGVTLVVAEIIDPDPEVLDATLSKLGGGATRRPAHDVFAEIQAAEGTSGDPLHMGREQRKARWERFKEKAGSKRP
jgi:hypothetical protein